MFIGNPWKPYGAYSVSATALRVPGGVKYSVRGLKFIESLGLFPIAQIMRAGEIHATVGNGSEVLPL